jgi:hypothetical protein
MPSNHGAGHNPPHVLQLPWWAAEALVNDQHLQLVGWQPPQGLAYQAGCEQLFATQLAEDMVQASAWEAQKAGLQSGLHVSYAATIGMGPCSGDDCRHIWETSVNPFSLK